MMAPRTLGPAARPDAKSSSVAAGDSRAGPPRRRIGKVVARHTRSKPSPQSIAASCQRLRVTNDGPCRYHPEFVPKAYETRYARGAVAAD